MSFLISLLEWQSLQSHRSTKRLTRERNLINNARFIGDCLHLVPEDIVCCPPPLFHCFGLCAGLLAAITHGSSIVYASRDFDADAVARTLVEEHCTILHGVPTMFDAIMSAVDKHGFKINAVRNGIAAGTKVPPTLLEQLRQKLGFRHTAVCYGKSFSLSTVPKSLRRDFRPPVPPPPFPHYQVSGSLEK